MRQLIKRLPPPLGWAAGAAAFAAFGAYNGGHTYAAMTAAFAVLMVAAGAFYTVRAKTHLRYVERFTAEQRALVNMGRRARWILLTVKDKEGKLYAASLAQILTDVTPEGRDMLWDTPEGAALFYMDPDGTYVEAEHGDAA